MSTSFESPTGDWGQPAGSDTASDVTAPDTTAPEGPAPALSVAHHGFSRPRRRLAAAVGAALVLGGGAGALATAVAVSGGTTTTVVKEVATASTAADATTVQGIVAKVEPALVDIETTGTSETTSPFGNGLDPFGGGGSTEQTAGAGTGMIIGSDGLILTNAHVLEGADTISVIYDGQTTSHRATLVGEDAAKDIALIKVTGASGLPTVTLAGSTPVQVGDAVLAIGNALNLQDGGFTVSNGIVSALGRSISTDNGENLSGLVQTSAAISSGDSGGALLDAAGQVIGMNTASAASSGTNTASNIGFAIPASEISSLIPQLEHGSIGATTVGSGNTATGGTGTSSTGSGGSYGGSYGSGAFGFSGGY